MKKRKFNIMFSHLSYLYSFSFLFLISFNSVVLIITKDFFVLYIFLIFQNLIILLLHLLKNFWLLYILLWYPNLDLRIHAIQIILTFERSFSNISLYDKIFPEAFFTLSDFFKNSHFIYRRFWFFLVVECLSTIK